MDQHEEHKPRRLGKRHRQQIQRIRGYQSKVAICERIAEDLEARLRAGEDPIDLDDPFKRFVHQHLPLDVSFEGVLGFETDETGNHFLAVCFSAVCPQRFRMQASGANGERSYLGLRTLLVFESLGDGTYEHMLVSGKVNELISRILGDRCPVKPMDADEAELDSLLMETDSSLAEGKLDVAAQKAMVETKGVADVEELGLS
tara:strand:+ start:984 stop:1589 length:606 start_codon:yes stop_codon:yes gene_type:complete